MSTTDPKAAANRPATAAQKRRAAKAAAQTKAPAAPIVDAPAETPAVVEPPVTETGEQSSVVAIESAASKRKARAAAAPAEDSTPSIPDLFRKGRTIAQIARTIAKGQDVVRAALDEAGVDYSADKNAKAVGSTPKATPAAKTPAGPRTLLASYNAVLAKTAAKGSKRERVVATLAEDANVADLKAIVQGLATADAAGLAAGSYALNSALSALYARVS